MLPCEGNMHEGNIHCGVISDANDAARMCPEWISGELSRCCLGLSPARTTRTRRLRTLAYQKTEPKYVRDSVLNTNRVVSLLSARIACITSQTEEARGHT